MTKKAQKIIVKDTEITIVEKDDQDYFSLTDMVKNFGGSFNKTIELGV